MKLKLIIFCICVSAFLAISGSASDNIGASLQFDRLAYSYDGNRVTEVENDCEGLQFYGRTGYPAMAGTYEWDAAGRMTSDGARLISQITYDYRDLPKTVKLADGTTEANTYDAAPSASSFHELSPYIYCGANPIRNVDLTGRRFTEASMSFVNKLMAETNEIIDGFDKSILKKRTALNDESLSAKKRTKLLRGIEKLNDKKAMYQAVKDEIDVLASSTQLYNIRFDTSRNVSADIMSGQGGSINNTSKYDLATNIFEMTVGDHHVGSIAHELKHAYQFETGLFSSGKTANPFYDQTDELDVYTRESLFRATSYSRQLPPNYNFLPKESRGLIQGEIYDEYLMQNLSNNTGSAFRWKGKTYKPQEQE